jgi:hypothetical protein
VLISFCGIPWAIAMVYPFTLVALSVSEEESGMYMGTIPKPNFIMDSIRHQFTSNPNPRCVEHIRGDSTDFGQRLYWIYN